MITKITMTFCGYASRIITANIDRTVNLFQDLSTAGLEKNLVFWGEG